MRWMAETNGSRTSGDGGVDFLCNVNGFGRLLGSLGLCFFTLC
jgi:hypothetical protein